MADQPSAQSERQFAPAGNEEEKLQEQQDMNMACASCGSRPGTIDWLGDAGVLALTHGMVVKWCEVCALTAQIEHARQKAAELPELEHRLAKALAEGESAKSVFAETLGRDAIDGGLMTLRQAVALSDALHAKSGPLAWDAFWRGVHERSRELRGPLNG